MKNSIFLVFAAVAILSSSCDKDKNTPHPVNEEELITTGIVRFSPHDGGDDAVFRFEDLDGHGGEIPVITNATLQDSMMYHVSVEFWNEAESPAENITEEVRKEGEEHQVFFRIGSSLDLSFTYDDTDSEGNPIGLESMFTTGAASSGILEVILRHEPAKDAEGVSEGDITNAGGETDVEVSFEVEIR